MVGQVCSIKPKDVATVSELLAKLELEDLDLISRDRESFAGLGMWSVLDSGGVKTVRDMQVDGWRGTGRPKLTWKKLTKKDCREWNLMTVETQERSTWRSAVKSAMRAASQLPEGGPLMWMIPLHMHVNQKSDYDDDGGFSACIMHSGA